MDTTLKFQYDQVGDSLAIYSTPSYPEQISEQIEYNIVARRNPQTDVIEGVEIVFFTRWLFKNGNIEVANLAELFSPSAAA